MKAIVLISLLSSSLLASSNGFSKAKKQMYKLWEQNPYTFYCNCKYDRKNKNNMIDRFSCSYEPRRELTKKGKKNLRAYRTEAEHIVPAENFYRQLPCSRTSKKDRNGLSKRAYCYKVNKNFQKFHDDIRNLVPSIGELNGDRRNYKYSALAAKKGQYGQCSFEVKNKRAHISNSIKGDIARTYFYIRDTYGYKMSKQETKLMQAWNKLDPLDNWEKKRIRMSNNLN